MVEEGAAMKTRTRVKRVLRSISERWRTSEVAASEEFYISPVGFEDRGSRRIHWENAIKTATNCRIYVEQESLYWQLPGDCA